MAVEAFVGLAQQGTVEAPGAAARLVARNQLASELNLVRAQVERIETIRERMKRRAVAKGKAILEAEHHLASMFDSGQPSVSGVKRVTERLGIMRGELQAIHLLAHIETTGVLTDVQIEDYDRIRGYVR